MDTKDWIILLAPLMMNGIGIFLLQRYYSNRIEKKFRKDIYIKDTVISFKKEVYNIHVKLAIIYRNQFSGPCMSESVAEFSKDFNDVFCPLYRINSYVLEPHKDSIDNVIDLSARLYKAFQDKDVAAVNYCGQKLFDSLEALGKELDKRIINIS